MVRNRSFHIKCSLSVLSDVFTMWHFAIRVVCSSNVLPLDINGSLSIEGTSIIFTP